MVRHPIPLYSKIVVLRDETPEKSEGGIYIPDVSKEKPERGKVIAVGKGRILDTGERIACTVQVGNNVQFRKYRGDDVTIDGVTYTIMEEDSILCIEPEE